MNNLHKQSLILLGVIENVITEIEKELEKNKKPDYEKLADKIEKSGVIGVENRAKYLGMSLKEYQKVQEVLDKRYKKPTVNYNSLADKIEKSGITGLENRAKYLGMNLKEYQKVQDILNKRYS